MGDFRARDADRDRTVELIEAAYVDGQLGDADRDLRVGHALAAVTLDELSGLTRDLQVPAGHVAPAVPGRAPAPRATRRVARALVALGAVAVLLGIAVTSLVTLASVDTDSATSTSSSPAAPVEVPIASEESATFAMAPAPVRKFLGSYEEQFGTLDVWEAGFYPARVGVQVPVRGARPRFERWSYDGSWRQDTTASAVSNPQGTADLATLDVRRLFANIAAARKTLDVRRGELTHVLVNTRTDGVSTVHIYIANSFDESGHLTTSMSGDVIRSHPYES